MFNKTFLKQLRISRLIYVGTFVQQKVASPVNKTKAKTKQNIQFRFT
jgi:hypothetical protein